MSRSRRRQETRRQTAPGPMTERAPALAWLRERVLEIVQQRPVLVALGLALLHVALSLLTFEPQPHTGGDNGAYISLARSLLERGAYLELWDPGEPPHTKYPPVFAGLLAVAIAAGLESFVQLKLVVMAVSAVAVAFSFMWMRSRGRPALALGAGILLAIAPGVLREGRWILSDVPFWCLSMIALWAFERMRPKDWTRFAIGAAAVLLAYFTRSAGLPLVLAALAWLAWRRHWPQLVLLAVIVGLPAIGWWLRTQAFGPAGYVSEFWMVNPYVPAAGNIGVADLFVRMLENSVKYATIHLPVLLTDSAGGFLTLVTVPIVIMAVVAWVRRAADWRDLTLADVFLPLYLGLILIWPPVWSGERFLLPVLPLLLLYAGESLLSLARRVAGHYSIVAAGAAALLLALLTLPALADGTRRSRVCVPLHEAGQPYACLPGPHWADFFGLAEWSAVALPDDAVVINRKPRLFFALGGQQGRIYPFSEDPAEFFDVVQSSGARYVVFDRVSSESDRYLRPVLAGTADAFCLMRVSEATGTLLLGILPTWPTALTAAGVPVTEQVGFEACGDEFWRSPEARRQLSVQ